MFLVDTVVSPACFCNCDVYHRQELTSREDNNTPQKDETTMKKIIQGCLRDTWVVVLRTCGYQTPSSSQTASCHSLHKLELLHYITFCIFWEQVL